MSNQPKVIEAIQEIYAKYEKNPYMEQKVVNYICAQLPLIFENIERTYIERSQRTDELTAEQTAFIQHFMYKNMYFYHSSTETFFYYDGDKYKQCGEDDILFNVLSSISRDASLMQWKHKTKQAIMKRIKENHLYKAIPESNTIQNALNIFYPSIFKTKTEAKYFLTILGENILGHGKTRDDENAQPLIHMVPPCAKYLIHRLNTLCQSWFGSNLSQTFKYKYHVEHNYSNIRIFNFNGDVDKQWFDSVLYDRGLDILCVACHYANRYGSSDNYVLKYSNDDGLLNSVFFLKNISQDTLVDMFIGEYVSVSSNVESKVSVDNVVLSVDNKTSSSVDNKAMSSSVDIKMSWKNIFYLWKHFLEAKRLPNVIIASKLKSQLMSRLADNYDINADVFVGINSKYLPSVCKFLQFWEETMEPDETEIELEIGEIASLFKKWMETRREHSIQMGEKQICDLIGYFYPEVEVDGDKYIYKIKNLMWDKQLDIQMAMEDLKDRLGCDNWRLVTQQVSLYDAYVHYSNYMNGLTTKEEEGKRRRPSSGNLATIRMIASKQYFDRFLRELV
jgi:hypothetical protein